jgi:ribonucleoside-diphosphate reductase alpha chain
MDISICFADFPTEAIGVTTRDYRQLGIGYANLGALLMATGHGYDSDGGRSARCGHHLAAHRCCLPRSAELAGIVGPYAGYARNADAHQRVMRKHAGRQRRRSAPSTIMDKPRSTAPPPRRGTRSSSSVPRTASATPRPPCWPHRDHRLHDGLRHHRHRAGLLAGEVQEARRRRLDADRQPDDPAGAASKLGYTEEIEAIVEYIADNGHVIDAPG